jgi:hypothetical protein
VAWFGQPCAHEAKPSHRLQTHAAAANTSQSGKQNRECVLTIWRPAPERLLLLLLLLMLLQLLLLLLLLGLLLGLLPLRCVPAASAQEREIEALSINPFKRPRTRTRAQEMFCECVFARARAHARILAPPSTPCRGPGGRRAGWQACRGSSATVL